MRAAVITIPEREENLNKLLSIIAPEIPNIRIFCDKQHKGHWFNYWRMFATMLTTA